MKLRIVHPKELTLLSANLVGGESTEMFRKSQDVMDTIKANLNLLQIYNFTGGIGGSGQLTKVTEK